MSDERKPSEKYVSGNTRETTYKQLGMILRGQKEPERNIMGNAIARPAAEAASTSVTTPKVRGLGFNRSSFG